MNQEQVEKVRNGNGFIAALDQSGGSTPKALQLYGVEADAYSNDEEMFDRMHEMRSRIITSPSFTGERVLGAILFEMTMDRPGRGQGDRRLPVVGQGRRAVPQGRQGPGRRGRRRPGHEADARPRRAAASGPWPRAIFGTKMRSVIKLADQTGVDAVVDQQFEVGTQILGHGLVPIIEPEVDIKSPQKAEAEALLEAATARRQLDGLAADQQVMLKLTLPGGGRLLRRPRRPPEGPPGRRPLRWLQPRGGQRPPRPQPRRDRQLLPRPHRGPVGRPESTRSSTPPLDGSIKSIFEASLT